MFGLSGPAAIDWEATLAFRRYLAGLGLGIAEAMDTAQRGMGLDWPGALELAASWNVKGDALSGKGESEFPELQACYLEAKRLVEEHCHR